MARSIGVVECKSYLDLLKAANEIDKAGDVHFVRYERIGDGIVSLVVEGETDEIKLALDKCQESEACKPGIAKTSFIPNVSTRVLHLFDLPRRWPY